MKNSTMTRLFQIQRVCHKAHKGFHFFLNHNEGDNQIIKMEILDGFCHEGGGWSRVPHTYSEK